MKGFEADGRLGTETPDAYCTLLRVACEFDNSRPYPEPRELWAQVKSVLEWVRVKARHYWVLHGQTGFGSVSRGSVLSQHGKKIQMSNFATYVPVVIVKPLSQELWQTISDDLATGIEPPVCEALFCDALLSAAAGEDLNAVLQLGVAAEIAITRLLMDAAGMPPTNPQKRKFLANGDWDKFHVKLEDWPSKLGLQSAKSFHPKGVMKDWVDVVKQLYRFRGAVAHSGRIPLTLLIKDIASYAFATNALIRYCREQRTRLGVPVYSYPAGQLPFDQLDAFTDVVLDSVASPAVSTLP
ncbi:MAG: hypothetical protein LAO06_07220 [Acidobacteriia bacterium]|nr:hypothetical protein [Terriglobia bacterium]